jgi:sarcosine oxidase subunit gamma
VADAKRVYAFESHAAAAVLNETVTPGVTIATRRVASMLNLRGDRDDVLLVRALGERITLPREPNTAAFTASTRALWLGPDEWLLVSEHGVPELASDLGGGSITDVSHGRASLRISGPDARAALAKGCALDLHPRAFPVNRCAQTAIAKVSVILDHVQPGVFDLYCPRSYAGSFWHWLSEACSEYRYRVAAPA